MMLVHLSLGTILGDSGTSPIRKKLLIGLAFNSSIYEMVIPAYRRSA